ncbi:MAG: exodeoxyribonuclease I [Pseudomonadota bacterium]
MSASFFWYDLETSGTHPGRDRVLQFAGVRTDPNLVLVDEPVNLYCYPGNDLIPEPGAIATTGIRMSELKHNGMNETSFFGGIAREFEVPGTCVAGYNSIRFDDEFTRYGFYRNFIDPYAREWRDGNSRWDVIDLFRMARALRPDGVVWPDNEDGSPDFRLEYLAAANQISQGDAHEAVTDVLHTVAMARLVRQAQPKLFDFMFRLRDKHAVSKMIYPLRNKPVVHVSSMYSGQQSNLSVVMPLCAHPDNRNGVLCYDLRVDPASFMTLSAEEVRDRIFTPRTELEANGWIRLPIKTVHLNRCPALSPLATLRPQDAERLGLDLDQIAAYVTQLQSDKADALATSVQLAFAPREFDPVTDPDRMLYGGGFFSDGDRAKMQELRGMDPTTLAVGTPPFDDPRVPEMVLRYRARNFPETLSTEDLSRWDDYRTHQFGTDDRLQNAIADTEHRLQDAPNDALSDLLGYLKALETSP